MKIKDRDKLFELKKKIFYEKENYTEEELGKFKTEYENLKNKVKKQQEKNIIKKFKTMKPFNELYEIPIIPVVSDKIYQEVIIPELIRCGAIPKKDLVIGKTYVGECRNASEAIWNGRTFVYERYKFGDTFNEEINHFEDDDGYDVFVPIKIKEDEKD